MRYLEGGGSAAIGFAPFGVRFASSPHASTDPHTLDDYEEGAFAPRWGGSVSDPTGVQSGTGHYRRIGDCVVAWGSITCDPGLSGGLGLAMLRGLPFALADGFYETSHPLWATGMGEAKALIPISGGFGLIGLASGSPSAVSVVASGATYCRFFLAYLAHD